MILAIDTQYRENYGAHDWDGEGECPQYWKNKGGSTYLVSGFDVSNASTVIDELTNLITQSNEYTQVFVINARLQKDTYCSEYEKWQKEEPMGDGVYYDTRVVRREDGTYFATKQYKGPRGQSITTYTLAPNGKEENRQYTEELYEK